MLPPSPRKRASLSTPIRLQTVDEWKDSADKALGAIRDVILGCDVSVNDVNIDTRTLIAGLYPTLREFRDMIQKTRDVLVQPAAVSIPHILMVGQATLETMEAAMNAASQSLQQLSQSSLKDQLVQLSSTGDQVSNEAIEERVDEFRTQLLGIQKIFQIAYDAFHTQWPTILDAATSPTQQQAPTQDEWIQSIFYKQLKSSRRGNIGSTDIQDIEAEYIGRSWVQHVISTDSGRSKLYMAERKLRDYIMLKGSPPTTLEELEKAAMPVAFINSWKEAQAAVIHNLRGSSHDEEPIRICVVGLANQGKSSFINSLSGRQVLAIGSGEVTAWPMITRHNQKCESPVLKIDPDHFEPYVELLRKNQFSRLKIKNGNTKFVHERRNFLRARPELEKDLLLFESKETPFTFKNEIREPNEIATALRQINNLMRSLWRLMPSTETLKVSNGNWPVLEVAFDCWKSQERGIEFIDLPGADEAKTELPESVIDAALRRRVDGYIFIAAANNIVGEAHRLNSKALSLTKLPALAAYGTHLDAIHDSKGIEKATYSINDIIYPMWDVLKTERIALCAPGLFISAKDAAELCGQQEVDINFLQDHPHYSAAAGAIYGTGDRAKEVYARVSRSEMLDAFQRHVEAWDMSPTITHVNQFAILDAHDRRQLLALREAREKYSNLIRTNKELINETKLRRKDFQSVLDNFLKFADAADEHLRAWEADSEKLKEERRIYLTELIATYEKKALASVSEVVEDERSKLFLGNVKRDSRVYPRKLETAVIFLEKITVGVVVKLRQLQQELVSTIRSKADAAWKLQLETLGIKLAGVEADLAPFLKDEILAALDAGAIGMEKAILEKATKDLSNSEGRTDESRFTLLERLHRSLAKTWIPHQQAEAALSNSQLDRNIDDDTIVAEALNRVGFMYRAPVDGVTGVPLVVDPKYWPFLNGTFPNWIYTDEIIAKYQDLVVKAWTEIITKECLKSLLGTIDLACEIGKDITEEIVAQRRKLYDSANARNRALLPSTSVAALEVSNTVAMAVHSAFSDICNRWDAELGAQVLTGEIPPDEDVEAQAPPDEDIEASWAPIDVA